MKGFFIYNSPIDQDKPTGVDKKVLAQIGAFQSSGLDCQMYLLEQSSGNSGMDGMLRALIRRLPFSNLDPKWQYDDSFDDIDFLYFRKPSYLTQPFRQMLVHLRRRNPKAKVVMEIPTYPYDQEYKAGLWEKPFIWKDQYNRLRLWHLIDCIVIVSEKGLDSVFGIPAVRMINGIDINSFAVRHPVENTSIDLCAVAMFSKWHGYDRLLKGLINYYQEGGPRDIIIHFAGDGPELASYRHLASHRLLENRVKFYGHVTGQDLETVYNIADFGVTSLGAYRVGINVGSFLKSRDYLAKGLPMITGCPIDVLDSSFPYYFEFPNDDTPIDFKQIVDMYDKIYSQNKPASAIAKSIRTYAEGKVDIRATMKPIIEYLWA